MRLFHKRKQIDQRPRHLACDGVEYLQSIPEMRKKLKGTGLLEGNIWPSDESERQEWRNTALSYLMGSSRIIGCAVEGNDPLFSCAPAPGRLMSCQFDKKGGKEFLKGETDKGSVEVEIPHFEVTPELIAKVERLKELNVVPLNDETHVYNGCSSTLVAGCHRLILAEDDIRLAPRAFWKKLILVGVKKLGDVYDRAEEEFALSPDGILLRLRKISEKLTDALQDDLAFVSGGLISSALLHCGMQSPKWFAERLSGRDDQLFFMTVVYCLLARDGIDPLDYLRLAQNLAEDPRFRGDYRSPGEEKFDSKGITQLMFEMLLMGGKINEKVMNETLLPFKESQKQARVSQFLRELQDAIQMRDTMMAYVWGDG